MNKTTAEQVLAISMDCTRETNDSVREVMEKCDAETFKIYRRHGGRIAGNLFSEIIAPIQSEHPELAPPDFKPMEIVERPKLRLTKETRDALLGSLKGLHQRLEAMAELVRENCEEVEAMVYRGRIYEVLVQVADATASVLAAQVESRNE